MKKGAFFSAALLSAALFLSSCSVFEGQDGASVSFTITGDMVKAMGGSRSLSPTEAGSLFLEITLEGGHSDVKTVPIVEGQAAVFDGVPIGASVSAIGKAFVEYGGAKVPTYTGKSDAILVKEGDNQLSLYLKKSGFYVSSTGDDTNGDGTQQNPYATLGAAVTKIYALNDPTVDYTIIIDGTVTGDAGGAYAQSKIEDDASTGQAIPAKSITLSGAHSLDADGNPQDKLDGGSDGTSSSRKFNYAVLSINTAVPVNVTNLSITGGNATGNGGAVIVNQGSCLSLADGALIIKNRATRGGGVFNQGTLYLYGTAVIGDKNASDYAGYNSSQDVGGSAAANFGSSGGGVYNGDTTLTVPSTTIIAYLYLGYRRGDDGLPVKAPFSGGIYFNGAGTGGAVYNARKSYVYMADGVLKYNGISGCGAGVYICPSGRMEMSGGQIVKNKASYNSSIMNGGGVCVDDAGSVFVMSGGIINENIALCTPGGTSDGKGGGVFNGGKMYMYGSAVIGNANASQAAREDSCGNLANIGGGIFNEDSTETNGCLYIGYKPGSDGVTPEAASFTGGIYYNYSKLNLSTSKWGGGGIYSDVPPSAGTVQISGGTIAYNATHDYGGGLCTKHASITGGTIRDNEAEQKGGAIYLQDNSQTVLSLGGGVLIPAGSSGLNDICASVYSDSFYSSVEILSALKSSFAALFTPATYNETLQFFKLAADADPALVSEYKKFSVTPQGDQKWIINTDGKLQKYIASTGTTITMNTGAGDIGVQVLVGGVAQTYDGTPINAGAATQISFVADSGCKTYTWKLDNHVVNPATDPVELLVPNQLDLIDLGDTTKWPTGVYEIELEAVAQDGTPYSFSAQVTVQ